MLTLLRHETEMSYKQTNKND